MSAARKTKSAVRPRVKTIDQAHAFVMSAGLCTIFADVAGEVPSLWSVTDLPERRKGEGGWGQKVSAVWTWKNELPAMFPDEIFYGKIAGGKAALMSMAHLRATHYPAFHRPIATCSPLAQRMYELIRVEPRTTGELRKLVLGGDRAKRGAFSKALIELQVTLNIVRLNAPEVEVDTWVRFQEQYPGIGV